MESRHGTDSGADVIWCETSEPTRPSASRKAFTPLSGKFLAYNLTTAVEVLFSEPKFIAAGVPKGKLLIRGYLLASFWSSAWAALRAMSTNPFAAASFWRALRRACPAATLPDPVSISPSASRAFN